MSSATFQTARQKRKAGPSSSAGRKRQKIYDIREIQAQTRDATVSATGELDVASFVKAREYEINALEKSIEKTKKALTMRAFQQVPRAVRRRTASHNVKKVPRRLRRRAEREMKEDNTPTVTTRRRIPSAKQRLRVENAKRLNALNQHSKTARQKRKEAKHNVAEKDPQYHISVTRVPKMKKNNLAEPPSATSKFKKRQLHKSWLPTHLWHTKRAHISRPSEPLWRMAVPISPTEKSYRPSHRASGGRGCIAWDMSYISTIGCQGFEASLDCMLKAIGFHGEGWSGSKYKRWKNGSRSADGWVFERDNDKQAVTPVVVLWCPHEPIVEKIREALAAEDNTGGDKGAPGPENISKPGRQNQVKSSSRRLFIRIHPSAFHQFWLLLLKAAKLQRPQVVVEDLRFEIGSIEVTGPGSTEALLGVLKPAEPEGTSKSATGDVWRSLVGLTNPASLPQNCLLALDVCDPRLSHPPKQIDIPKDLESADALVELMFAWPPDNGVMPPNMFSHKCRHITYKNLLSQKAINRRKALAPPGQSPAAKATDPRIPVLILAGRPPTASAGAQGTWTVLLPWKTVDAIWRSLMYYPLSSGGTPRFGGLDQKRQICFEHGEAWFPGDVAATEAGQAWERTESAKRFDEWTRRPPSRRVAWETVDLGNGRKGEHGRGWTCDWNYLLRGKTSEPTESGDDVQEQRERIWTSGRKDDKSEPRTQKQRKLAKKRREEQASLEPSESSADVSQLLAGTHSNETHRSLESGTPPDSLSKPSKGRLMATPSFVHLPPSLAVPLVKGVQKVSLPFLPSLFTVRITLLTRGTPIACARIYRLPFPGTPAGDSLRKSWLLLDPTTFTKKPADGQDSRLGARMEKDKLNHRGNPKRHTVHPFESLDHVNYTPADAPSEYFKTPEHLKQVEAQAAALAAASAAAALRPGSPTAEDRVGLMQALMVPVKDPDGNAHPACPDAEDLIGFVTSGAYNLADGRGTAIGSIWVQKVVEGWTAEVPSKGSSATAKQDQKKMERQKRLCVVRNAGESVGRLGVWELCW